MDATAPAACLRLHVSAVSAEHLEARGVCHPEEPLADVVGARAVCAQYDSPDGVALSLQV